MDPLKTKSVTDLVLTKNYPCPLQKECLPWREFYHHIYLVPEVFVVGESLQMDNQNIW